MKLSGIAGAVIVIANDQDCLYNISTLIWHSPTRDIDILVEELSIPEWRCSLKHKGHVFGSMW
jgi:hypothetical protein